MNRLVGIPWAFWMVGLLAAAHGGCGSDTEPGHPPAGHGGSTQGGAAGKGGNAGKSGSAGGGEGGQVGTDGGSGAVGGDRATGGDDVGNGGSPDGRAGDEPGDGGTVGGGAASGKGGTGGDGGTSNAPSGGNPSGGAAGVLGGEGGVTGGEGGQPSGAGGEASGEGGGAGLGGTGGAPNACSEPGATRDCCRGGTQTCVAGTWGACEGAFISNESCNGIDDDCDGEVDELGTFSCGIGACARTVSACNGGALAVCLPATPAASTDGCNGIDDDCDGAVDEDCAACVHVSTVGDDASAAASDGATPFASVQAAIDFADMHRSISTRVCVAPGASCGATGTFAGPTGGDLTMRSGIDVLANYESTTWTRCTNSTTHLAPTTALGVVFPAGVADQTVLDGFAIDRFFSDTTAGVTVDGGRGALLSNLSVVGGPDVSISYGVNIVNGGRARIFRSRIDTGGQVFQGVAVRAVDSQVVLDDNCPGTPNATTGRCALSCTDAGPGILARYLYGTIPWREPPTQMHAIVLENSPGSRIERSGVCTDLSSQGMRGDASVVRVTGDAAGFVLRSSAVSYLAQTPIITAPTKSAVLLRDCGGASPWVVDNAISSRSALDDIANVIAAAGDCHPVIESNPSIRSESIRQNRGVNAILCDASAGVASRCVVAKNGDVTNTWSAGSGGSSRYSFSGTGVNCLGGSCTRIDGNVITGATGACCQLVSTIGIGVSVDSETVVVADNTVTGECTGSCTSGGVGIEADAARGLMERNTVLASCASFGSASCGSSVHSATALRIASTLEAEWVVRSNDIRALRDSPCGGVACCDPTVGPCNWPVAVSLSGTAGVFEDNVVSPGKCRGGRAVVENTTGDVHPRIFENNDLTADVTGYGLLYLDTVAGGLVTAAAVDGLSDMTASGTTATTCQ